MLKNSIQFSVIFAKRSYVNLSRDSVPFLFDGLVEGNRAALARSITLIETSNDKKKVVAQELLDKVLNHLKHSTKKKSFRIGILC